MGSVVVVAIFYVIINLLIDIFQAFLDPRVTL
jgi:ABC-type dipeptide/oligopeptide/nickel transport system permease component